MSLWFLSSGCHCWLVSVNWSDWRWRLVSKDVRVHYNLLQLPLVADPLVESVLNALYKMFNPFIKLSSKNISLSSIRSSVFFLSYN